MIRYIREAINSESDDASDPEDIEGGMYTVVLAIMHTYVAMTHGLKSGICLYAEDQKCKENPSKDVAGVDAQACVIKNQQTLQPNIATPASKGLASTEAVPDTEEAEFSSGAGI